MSRIIARAKSVTWVYVYGGMVEGRGNIEKRNTAHWWSVTAAGEVQLVTSAVQHKPPDSGE